MELKKLKLQSLVCIFLLMLLLTACSEESKTSMNENITDEPIVESPVTTPLPTNEVNEPIVDNSITDDNIIWMNKELGFALEGKIAEDGLINVTTIKWKNSEANFINWRNSAIREPSVFVHDLNQDQSDELIVVNILDHGSGFIVTEPHVLNSETSEEILIESLVDIITEHVTFEFENSKNSIVLSEDQVIFADETEGRQIEAKFDDWINYTVSNGKLIGSVQVGDGTASGIRGYLNVIYKYEDGRFIKDLIEFNEDSPVGAEPIPLTYSTGVEGGM